MPMHIEPTVTISLADYEQLKADLAAFDTDTIMAWSVYGFIKYRIKDPEVKQVIIDLEKARNSHQQRFMETEAIMRRFNELPWWKRWGRKIEEPFRIK